jgi:hypothetical protein
MTALAPGDTVECIAAGDEDDLLTRGGYGAAS